MERGASGGRTELVTPVKQPTDRALSLILRSRAHTLKDEVGSDLTKKAEEFRVNYKSKSTADIKKEIHEIIQECKKKTNDCFDEMEKEISGYAPKPPKRREGESDAEFKERERAYQEELDHYKTLAETSVYILKGITWLFQEVFMKVKEFFNDLWNWIKQAMKNIGQKIASFFKMIGQTINAGLDKLFS